MPLELATNTGAVDRSEEVNSDFLNDLQGNILNGHGRDNALHIFVKFKASPIEVAKWISKFSQHFVTPASRQLSHSDDFKISSVDGGLFGHFALSAKGYQYLGFSHSQLPQPSNLQKRTETIEIDGRQVQFYDPKVFEQGMKSRQKVLRDPEPNQWEVGYHDDVHALVLLAADDPADLVKAELEITNDLITIGQICTSERGYALRRKFNRADEPEYGVNVEHFGYVDGRSQPLFLKEQVDHEREVGGTDLYDPEANLNIVLVQDPNGTKDVSFGSFLVFRKLEQNVQAFKIAEMKVAAELGLPRTVVGAMAVGRFEDGTPVVQQPSDGQSPVRNNFDYSADNKAMGCPFHAHVRKTNPRGETVNAAGPTEQEERNHRIARRGIPYGGPLTLSDDPEKLPTKGVGLLFMCYQSDIWEQFEFIQRFWSNNPRFLSPDFSENNPDYDKTGLDPLIGQAPRHSQDNDDPVVREKGKAPKNWPSEWGKSTVKVRSDFADVVKLKGGEYFFSPSLTFCIGLPDLLPT